MKAFALLLTFFMAAQSWALATADSCRLTAAQVVLQDLNKYGKLWELHKSRSGEIQITVKGKPWLEISNDLEFYECSRAFFVERTCVEYKFQDPETRRVEHIVAIALEDDNCAFRDYRRTTRARAWN